MKVLKSALRLLIAAVVCTDLVSSQEDYGNENVDIKQHEQDPKFVGSELASPVDSGDSLNSRDGDEEEEEPELVVLVPAAMGPNPSPPQNGSKEKTGNEGLDGTGEEEMSVVDFVRRSRERVRERRASSRARRRLGDDDDDGKGKGTKSSGKGKGVCVAGTGCYRHSLRIYFRRRYLVI